MASTRVIPICVGEGQAVGTKAAALAVGPGAGISVRQVPTAELQDTLVSQGAEIGRTVGEPNWAAIEEVGQLPIEEPPTGDKDAAPVRAGGLITLAVNVRGRDQIERVEIRIFRPNPFEFDLHVDSPSPDPIA